MKIRLTFLTAIGLAASAAQAASAYDPATRTVPYDDRALASDDGMANLHRRISVAADQVCLDPYGPSPAATVNLVCRADALRSAHAQLAAALAEDRLPAAQSRDPR